MPRYLLLWEVDQAKIPISLKERGAGWAAMMKMVRQGREKISLKIGVHLMEKTKDTQLWNALNWKL